LNTVLEGQTGAPRHKVVDTTPDPDVEYPNSNGVTSFVSMDYKPNYETTITIPRNIKGHSLQIKGYNDRGVQVNYDTYVSAWGHSPHKHQ